MIDGNAVNSDCTHKHYGKKAALAQVLATIAQIFLLIGLGMELSMSTIVIRDLYQKPNSEFSLTTNEISWYGSILFIFHPTGSFLSGFLQERFGRKRCMIFANIPSIIGWILLYFTNSSLSLYVSTLMMGLSIGFSEAPILSYVGEITEPRLRGSMTSLASTSAMFGCLIIYILGFLFDWRRVALLSTTCPVLRICFVLFIPESPIWLVGKGETKKAEKALRWLRGWVKPEVVNAEFNELIHYNEVSGTQGGRVDTKKYGFFSNLAEFKDPLVYKPLTLVMLYFFISHITCLIPARPFITKIMSEVGIIDNQNLLLIIFGVLQNVGAILVILTVNYVGKRFLTMFSLTINTILIFSFGIYIIAMKNNYISSIPLIPTILMSSILFFGACGIACVPWMLLSEVFPNKSRGIATGTCAGLSYLLIFTLTKLYLTIEMLLTLEYTIVLFGCIGIAGLVYLYFYLPETENKTLLEIEEFFATNSRIH